jgi:hypothetical protein
VKLDLNPPKPAPKEQPVYEAKRRHPRHQLPVRCWLNDGVHTMYLRVHDVSAGGLSVRAPVAFLPDHDVQVRLELPGGRVVIARGRVVWVRPGSGEISGPRMGACFIELTEGADELYNLVGQP